MIFPKIWKCCGMFSVISSYCLKMLYVTEIAKFSWQLYYNQVFSYLFLSFVIYSYYLTLMLLQKSM